MSEFAALGEEHDEVLDRFQAEVLVVGDPK